MKHYSLGASTLLLLAAAAVTPFAARAESDLLPGQLVKGQGSAVYYLDADLHRYAFPNERVYKSWYDGFGDVRTVSDADLSAYPMGGTVPYKAATRLVKIQSDPKVYAVDDGGILRWVKTEEDAVRLYGGDWRAMVDDLADAFFTGYERGEDIGADSSFDVRMHTAIPDIMHTLRESRLRALRVRGAGDAEMANDGYGSNKKAFCRTLGASGSVTLYVDDAAADGQLRSGATAGKCGDAPTTPPAAEDPNADRQPSLTSSNVTEVTANSAVIEITASEEVSVAVWYSTMTPVSTSTGTYADVTAAAETQRVALTGLSANTTYFAIIVITDADGNEVVAEEKTFTTLAQ